MEMRMMNLFDNPKFSVELDAGIQDWQQQLCLCMEKVGFLFGKLHIGCKFEGIYC
jgi:hypothetical protein